MVKWLGEPEGKASNGNHPFRCPFHSGGQETKASFFLHEESGMAFCHACNEGWNLPQLLKRLGAAHSVISVASKLLGTTRRKGRRRAGESRPLTEDVLAIVTEYCSVDLLEAGFDKDLLQRYEVGFDPYEEVPVYPIRDRLGRLMALSGRYPSGYLLYGERQLRQLIDDPKIRLPEAVTKSRYLWNLHNIYPTLLHGNVDAAVIVVEGFKACLWCIQNGYPYTVALMGSYLSEEQAVLLERVTTRVIVFLDQDRAGSNGSFQALERMRRSTIPYIADYPRPGKLQPDSLTHEELNTAIKEARPYYRASSPGSSSS